MSGRADRRAPARARARRGERAAARPARLRPPRWPAAAGLRPGPGHPPAARAGAGAHAAREYRDPVVGRFADLEAQLAELHQDLRDLAHSLEPRSLLQLPLPDAVARELTALSRRTGIATSLEQDGSFDALSASQRIALLRVLQEALSNIRQHSGAADRSPSSSSRATTASRMEIRDDGHGFDPEASSPTTTVRAGSASSGCASGCGCSAAGSSSRALPAGRRWSGRSCRRGRYATILIGVPTGTSSFRRRIASFATRTQPCETACPSSEGVFVPWIPTMPPPGHSLSFE